MEIKAPMRNGTGMSHLKNNTVAELPPSTSELRTAICSDYRWGCRLSLSASVYCLQLRKTENHIVLNLRRANALLRI